MSLPTLMHMMFQYGLLLLGFVAAIDFDPCQEGQHVIMDDPTRFSIHVTDLASSRCDTDIVKQWYRIRFGSVATTPPPDINRCGTMYPVWIVPETLPVLGESQIATICLRTNFETCAATGSVEVKNCGSFYVYELRKLNDDYCDLGYCLEPDTSIIVLPSVTPSLTQGSRTVPNHPTYYPSRDILFTCTLEANTGVDRTALFYDVIWYINGREVKRRTALTYTALQSDGTLRENEWTTSYSLPMQVACAIKAGSGNLELSAPFYAGLKVELSGVSLQEKGELDLSVQLTVPLGCLYKSADQMDNDGYERNNCKMDIRVVTPQSESDQCSPGGVSKAALQAETCVVTVYHSTWDTATVIKVNGATDNMVNTGYRSARLQLRTDTVTVHSTWNNVHAETLEPIYKILVVTYELQKSGEYILYRHDGLFIEIQAFFQPCIGWGLPGATCNCAIGVRYQNTVFRANFCQNTAGGYNSVIEFNGCDKDVMKIKTFRSINRFGSGYEIVLPSGTVVNFKYGSMWMDSGGPVTIHNIYVKPSVADWTASSGLCGYLDGTTDNDFVMRNGSETQNADEFSNSWKVHTDSLFDPMIPSVTIPISTIHEYCICNDDVTASCSGSLAKPCPSSSSSSTTSDYVGYLDRCNNDRKRRDSSDDDTVYLPSWPNLAPTDDTESEVPDWTGNWTEASAAEACRDYLRASPLIQMCESVLQGFDSEVYVPDCTKDIKATGSTMFMESTLNLLQTACISEAVRLENLTNERTDSGVTILEDLLSISCPNNCSNVGTCVNGTCECEAGYDGTDCSESGDIPPYLPQNRNIGMCDLSINVCSKLVIAGENFMPAQLTCKAQRFKLDDGVVEVEGEPVTFSGTYVNSYLAVCSIPASRKRRSTSTDQPTGYKISMSNDGTTFSDEITFIIYNLNCFECNITAMTCSEMSDSCNQQTVDVSSKDSKDSNSSETGIAVGVTLTIVVVIVVVLAGLYWKKPCLKKSAVENEKNPEPEYTTNHSFSEQDIIVSSVHLSHSLPAEKRCAWVGPGSTDSHI
ncbi:von Willebrand factor D and EGF domain-containing protein-like [Argopecten irradians]|uniref:von Willebrand factor D and EGF domain-containing protein-like n=1 Tax=Argopecten irradians TaxID=31199 RepID=UPI00371E4970